MAEGEGLDGSDDDVRDHLQPPHVSRSAGWIAAVDQLLDDVTPGAAGQAQAGLTERGAGLMAYPQRQAEKPRIGCQHFQRHPELAPQLLLVVGGLDRLPARPANLLTELRKQLLGDGPQQLVLVGEVLVEGGVGHAGRPRTRARRDRLLIACENDLSRRFKQPEPREPLGLLARHGSRLRPRSRLASHFRREYYR